MLFGIATVIGRLRPHKPELSLNDVRWAAVVSRDKSSDGAFYYSVATTGVYCRPSCPSRAAKRSNVRFHETTADAETAGFRPCKRCNPRAPSRQTQQAAIIATACRSIEAAEVIPKLKDLAAAADMSPFHFHRMFKSATGVTPKAYAEAHRHKRVKANLMKPATRVTAALFDAGFASSSRFYAKADEMLGMTPARYRNGGAGIDLMFAIGECWLGSILIAATNKGVACVLIGDDPDILLRNLQDRFPQASLHGGDKAFEALSAKVIALVDQPSIRADIPLDIQGTVFQHKVWKALTSIPAGKTASYAEIAKRIGDPKAVRAVAGACGANPVGVIIPCHRVVRSDGALSGYRWGIERKRALQDREVKSKTDSPQNSVKARRPRT
jgi:AraC family transcriptional regulator, regulatory protein of adaptative response / methylated-DNA-[protein]-cysteine methyltransferase